MYVGDVRTVYAPSCVVKQETLLILPVLLLVVLFKKIKAVSTWACENKISYNILK